MKKEIYKVCPLLCTRGAIIFPKQELTIEIGRKNGVVALKEALKTNKAMFVASQVDISKEEIEKDNLYPYGCLCSIISYRKIGEVYRVNLCGLERAKMVKYAKSQKDFLLNVQVEIIKDYYFDAEELEYLFNKALNEFNKITKNIKLNDLNRSLIGTNLAKEYDASTLSDTFAAMHIVDLDMKQNYLSENCLEKRLEMMLQALQINKHRQELDDLLDQKVKESIEENQRDYLLREKLKAIKSELDENGFSDLDDLRERYEKEPFPERIKQKIKNEFKHYDATPSASPEAGIIRTYIETLMNVPWYLSSKDCEDLKLAEKILNEDHYGLTKVKNRILEYLAVKQMTGNLKSPILCLVGPPGVGKTSLAKSVARALNRKFVKVSLGGVHDEAEIRGHRRTYLGSMPGRIITGMKKAGVINPVFLLDEIDKMASDFKGDPSSALLEVLDPEQNIAFSDNYLEEPYDLSNVLFIATANYLENISPELRDRLELIELSSYTEHEKVKIAANYIVPKVLEANALKKKQFSISENNILYLIRHYTREAGVRQLERLLANLARKTVLAILKDKKDAIKIGKKVIVEWLGNEKFDYGLKEKENQIGVVTGLAYTSFGGDILPIEVTHFAGKGKLIVTGQLGDVMKESTEIAYDYVKANASKLQIPSEFFEQHDLHIHCPEGAVPKDGPSAGVTLTTALVSAITGRKVKKDVAMTGEVTLRGRVLPIGGLREKTIAAHRSGITTIFIPKKNANDLSEIPESIRKTINFILVEDVSEVIEGALL